MDWFLLGNFGFMTMSFICLGLNLNILATMFISIQGLFLLGQIYIFHKLLKKYPPES